jgi:hypothetical protein
MIIKNLNTQEAPPAGRAGIFNKSIFKCGFLVTVSFLRPNPPQRPITHGMTTTQILIKFFELNIKAQMLKRQ